MGSLGGPYAVDDGGRWWGIDIYMIRELYVVMFCENQEFFGLVITRKFYLAE